MLMFGFDIELKVQGIENYDQTNDFDVRCGLKSNTTLGLRLLLLLLLLPCVLSYDT